MSALLPIRFEESLSTIYGNPTQAHVKKKKWDRLISEFERSYGRAPTYIAMAPGRVNLIGEHIDYALFGVLPAAIEREVLIACSPEQDDDTGRVVAENLDSKYERQSFTPTKDASGKWYLEIDKNQLRWESYVKAGYYGVLNRCFNNTDIKPKGCSLLVLGDVPPGSGLSSSAALVVASTLAFLVINDKVSELSQGDLVELTMENEKRVGVNSGGMDQAASVLSTHASALYITFHPRLSAEPVPLISKVPFRFVCANSLVVADKVVSSKFRYNLRVVETLVAARILAHRLGIAVRKDEKVTLKQVVHRFLGVPEAQEVELTQLKKGLETVLSEVPGLKHGGAGDGEDPGLVMEEMIELSGLTSEEFHDLYLSWVEVEATHFQLYKRATHVLSEALRVLQFREVCMRPLNVEAPRDNLDEHRRSDEKLKELGELMNESQKSCAKMYECSCPELDELTRLAREAGAYGSRLTGAGWGGCTVSLVRLEDTDKFIQKLTQSYEPYRKFNQDELQEVIFATEPSNGAIIYKVPQ